ncbi:MAG: GNAT family N-acetyltransferase [Kineosporiaceae bacterium]|nr:GNAT family N-acetyltransferase [Kineosporiaceae bacterium]MBK7625320.1 GNAT family N-acetyltransferase [Kineosporiaceae bacterium]MBK8076319.1 GNAT family N-acetyltransferase [Kineosporiaceae bacterium]
MRMLDRVDLDEALDVCARDPVANVFVAARLRSHGVSRSSGGELWGYYDGGSLDALCWSGANLVPVEANPDAIEAFAYRALRQGRHCSSIVGASEMVMPLWSQLSSRWGRARDIRDDQPLMALDGPPLVAPDPLVRLARVEEIDLVTPACVAMFTEEVGYSPVLADGGSLYRSQVAGLVTNGRSLVRLEVGARGPEVVFKAEIGSVTPQAAQVQGVWVAPEHRGRGVAIPGMAAVAAFCRRDLAPIVSLYVNAYNSRAVHVYERVGFTRVGTFATVLF